MKKLMFVAVFGLAGLLAACGDSGGSGGSSGIVGTWKVDTEYLKTMMDAKMKEQAGGDEVPQAMLDMMKPMLDKMMTEMGKITITFNADGTMTGVGPKESDGPPVMETKKGKWTKTDKGSKVFNLTSKLRAGVIWANTYNKFDPTSPFGGYKESGYGREGGVHGLGTYLNLN